jgi:hypothetical protein
MGDKAFQIVNSSVSVLMLTTAIILAEPTIDDQKYDELMRELIELEKKYPDFLLPIPSQKLVANQIRTSYRYT